MTTDVSRADLTTLQGQIDRLELAVRLMKEAEEQRTRRAQQRFDHFVFAFAIAVPVATWTFLISELVRGG